VQDIKSNKQITRYCMQDKRIMSATFHMYQTLYSLQR